jgi:hypothetical protein
LQRRDPVGHDIGTARALRASTTYDWIALIKMTKLLEIRAAYGCGRRALRRQLLERRYTTLHSLGRMDACAPIQMLASGEHTDDVLVY